MNYDNNLLAILSWASTRSTWVSVSSCASQCGISYIAAYHYFERDDFVQVAHRYRYDYVIRGRPRHRSMATALYLSVVSRGYA